MKLPAPMKVYTIRDHTGAESTHLAVNEEGAIQAHMIHYGQLQLTGKVEVVSIKELIDVKDRNTICYNLHCQLAGANK